MSANFDIAIVGAGLVGLATACALRDSRLQIAIIDTKLPTDLDVLATNNIGIRASAINHASQQYFEEIGIWEPLCASHRVQPFSSIQVWEKGGNAQLSACCGDYGYSNLGYIIENKMMQHYLYQCAKGAASIKFFQNECSSTILDDESVFLRLANDQVIQSKLIIGADGASSWVRQQEKIPLIERDYIHHSVITTIETEYPHEGCAKQLFYADGIVAFLPLFEKNKSCLVWSSYPENTKKLHVMPAEQFSEELFALTGEHVGKSQLVNDRMVFPLKARFAEKFVKHRVALIGDAAHTIHPLAGQGVNLGFQDSALLVSTIKRLKQSGLDIGVSSHFKSFQFTRRKETLIMMAAMQTIQDMFDGNHSIKKRIRRIGMNAIDRLPMIKKQLIKYAMNLS